MNPPYQLRKWYFLILRNHLYWLISLLENYFSLKHFKDGYYPDLVLLQLLISSAFTPDSFQLLYHKVKFFIMAKQVVQYIAMLILLLLLKICSHQLLECALGNVLLNVNTPHVQIGEKLNLLYPNDSLHDPHSH